MHSITKSLTYVNFSYFNKISQFRPEKENQLKKKNSLTKAETDMT